MDLYKFLDWIDANKWFRYLFAPLWLFFEWLTLRKYWKIILSELCTSDEIVDFLDRNEFGLKGYKIYKKDLIDTNEILIGKSLDECKIYISKEYMKTLCALIESNSALNIEDLLNMTVTTDLHISKVDDEVHRNRIYTVTLQFWRKALFDKSLIYTTIWILLITIISGIIFIVI